MAMSLAYGGQELLQIADAVAREKGIQRESVLEAMAQAIQIAGRRKYGHEHNILADIDPKTGEIQLYRVRDVVEEVEDEATQLTLKDAQKIDKDLEVGSQIKDPLPPIDFGRIAAQTAKQVIVQKVRDAEREKQFEEFEHRVGEVINGLVKRVEFGNVTVDLGRGEAVLRREESIPARCSAPATASAPISMMYAASAPARRCSCPARIRNSWPSSSRRKCRKSTMVSSKSALLPVTRVRARKSPLSPTIPTSTPLALALVCVAPACKPW